MRQQKGMTLIECMFAISVLAVTMTFLLHSYATTLKINKQTQEIELAYHAGEMTLSELQDMTSNDLVGYLGQIKSFPIEGMINGNDDRCFVQVENATNSTDTEFKAGVLLKITVTVLLSGKQRAKLVGFKYDGGGKIEPSSTDNIIYPTEEDEDI